MHTISYYGYLGIASATYTHHDIYLKLIQLMLRTVITVTIFLVVKFVLHLRTSCVYHVIITSCTKQERMTLG